MDAAIPRVSTAAALIAEPARARMLTALMSSEAMTATELAMHGRVTPQTASAHLSAMRDAGLITAEKRGRSRYYKLAGAEVATAIETLQVLAADGLHPGWRSQLDKEPIRIARTCYDHLAGKVGVEMTESMERRGYLRRAGRDFHLTSAGERFFVRLGIDVDEARKKHRRFARQCLDWSERRMHLAGSLGAALALRCFQLGWLRRKRDSRVLTVTRDGASQLRRIFSIDAP